jgi:hypothetical protein
MWNIFDESQMGMKLSVLKKLGHRSENGTKQKKNEHRAICNGASEVKKIRRGFRRSRKSQKKGSPIFSLNFISLSETKQKLKKNMQS